MPHRRSSGSRQQPPADGALRAIYAADKLKLTKSLISQCLVAVRNREEADQMKPHGADLEI